MRIRVSTIMLGLFAIPACVVAQPNKPDSVKVIRADSVIVTTARSHEALIDVPMAVSSVPARDYATGRGFELKDALRFTPGVFAQARSGHTDLRITIRGFGARGAANRSNAGNMRGIRVLIDGIPETEPDGRTSLDLVNLDATDHVEVLRSNASTLYGSASGGVINLSTRSDFTTPFVETRNTFGSFNFLRNTISAGTLTGKSTIFASFTNTTYGDKTNRAFREHSGSSQMLATFGIQSQLDAATNLGVFASATSNLFRFPGPLTRAQMDSDYTQANADFVKRDERRWNRQGRLAVVLSHQIGAEHEVSGTIFLQPKVLERSERNTYRDFNRYGIGAQARYQWSTKISPSLSNRLTVGFDEQYQDGTILFYSLTPSGSRGDVLQQNKQEAANTVGGYAENSLTLNDVWMLRLGARFDEVTYRFRNFTVLEPATGAQNKTFNHLTPKASLSWRFANGHMIYAGVGGGVEAAAYNEVDPPSDSLIIARGGTPDTVNKDFNPLLDPTTSASFELGTRGFVALDGAFAYLNYDVAAYLISIKNDIIPWSGGRYYFTAGESRRTGVELAATLATTFGVSLQGAFTIGNSEYVHYENELGTFDGNSTAGLPTTFGNVRVRYDASFGAFIEAGVEHVGSYFADDRNDMKADGTPDPTVDSKVDAYSLLNLTAGWKGEVGPLDVDLFAGINNIADVRYAGSAFINGEKNQYFEPGMPRNVVVGATLRYR